VLLSQAIDTQSRPLRVSLTPEIQHNAKFC